MSERIALGMMSGTSCDGIDAAVVAVRGHGLGMKTRLRAHVHRAFSPELRKRLLAVMAPATTTVDELLHLSVALAEAHVPVTRSAIKKAGLAQPPTVIGVHGQTICHRPPERTGQTGASWQLGQFAPLAAAMQVPVVYDFRAADLAVGGQGAPLVPWTDWVLASDKTTPRVLVNLGGVCNATFLPPGGGPQDVRAGDIGPCNILLDGLIARRTGGEQTYDRNGQLAAKGQVQPEWAEKIMKLVLQATVRADGLEPDAASPTAGFTEPGSRPKSLGREQFNEAFLQRALSVAKQLPTPDLLATATEVVARRLSWPIRAWAGLLRCPSPAEVIVAGGGVRNRALVAAIGRHLPELRVKDIQTALGLPAEAKEAVSFALLALANLDNIPANLPQVTGAACPAVLGVRIVC